MLTVTYNGKETCYGCFRNFFDTLQVIEDIINRMLDFKAAWPFWHNVSKKDVSTQGQMIEKRKLGFKK